LKYFPNLLSLDISWEADHDSTVDATSDTYQFWILKGISWPHLKRLRIQSFPLTQANLAATLLKHSRSLEYLSIRECSFAYLEALLDDEEAWYTNCVDPKIKALLTLLRHKFSLKKFELVLPAKYDGDYGALYDGASSRINENDWKASPGNGPISTDWKTISGVPPNDEKLIEHFVLGRCPWPMDVDHPLSFDS